ncbi:MAG: cytochrome c oxidase subunit II [Pseudomonadota bacterium]
MGHTFGYLKVTIIALCAAVAAVIAPAAMAQEEAPAAEVVEEVAEAAPNSAYAPMAPTADKGMPTAFEDGALKSMTFQDQYTDTGAYALGMHNYVLMPVITFISLFVLGLLLYVIVRYSRRANPVPSRTTHNTAIEVFWTILPVLILVVIAIPSITLLARQYETPPEDAITVKAIGYQWYWGYEYPDHGGFEVISNMKKRENLMEGEPFQLAVDNRMVVQADTPIRMQTTGADVIHSFAIPSLWFKQDAIPGRLNEKLIDGIPEGVYYGNCTELCGTLHGYMPVTIEALPRDKFEAWVLEQGGELPGEVVAEAPASEGEADTAEPAEVALAD